MSQFQSFFISANGDNQCEELNRFMKSHVIIRTVENLISSGTNCGVQILVEYRDTIADTKTNKKTDYRASLKNDEQRIIFDRLKDFRARLTKEHKLVGAYMVCKDEHLAAIAMNPKITLDQIMNLPRSGNILLKDYAKNIYDEYQRLLSEASAENRLITDNTESGNEESAIPF